MRVGKIGRAVIVGLLAAGAVLAATAAAHADYKWTIGPAGSISTVDDQTSTDPADPDFKWTEPDPDYKWTAPDPDYKWTATDSDFKWTVADPGTEQPSTTAMSV